MCVCLLALVNIYAEECVEQTLFTSGEGAAQYRIPSMITTTKGTVIALCDARVDRGGDVPNNIDQVLRRSTDNGKTWGEIITAVDLPGMHGAADPSLVQDCETGRIFMFYGYCPGRNNVAKGANRDRRHLVLQYVYSDDDGLTWSLPIHIDVVLRKAGWHSMWPGPGRGMQTRKGQLVVPCTVYMTDPEQDTWSYMILSDDHGKTWRMSEGGIKEINEPTIVELEDSRWMANCRTRKGNRAISYSQDGGKTWTEPIYHETLIEPGCQASMITATAQVNGKKQMVILLSNPASRKGRKNMTVSASLDNGKTWPIRKVIYPGGSAYSCLTVLPDGTIGLLYEADNYGVIQFTSFSLKWLADNEG